MADEKLAPPAPIEPVQVVMIGTGDGGAPIPSGQMLVTPDHQPNLVVQVITPIAAMAIRFANAYLTALVGLVTAGMVTNVIPSKDFADLAVKCAGLSLAGPCIALVKDIITILTGLERKFPLATGSV